MLCCAACLALLTPLPLLYAWPEALTKKMATDTFQAIPNKLADLLDSDGLGAASITCLKTFNVASALLINISATHGQ